MLVGLAAGVPVGLARLGSPLPTHWPAWSGIFTDLRVGYVPAADVDETCRTLLVLGR